MKRLMLAALAVLSMSLVQARHYRGYNDCDACPAPVVSEPCPPVCTKTVVVPRTEYDKVCVTVPAKRIEIPQPDRVWTEEIPQPCKKVVHREHVPPVIRYECPTECDNGAVEETCPSC